MRNFTLVIGTARNEIRPRAPYYAAVEISKPLLDEISEIMRINKRLDIYYARKPFYGIEWHGANLLSLAKSDITIGKQAFRFESRTPRNTVPYETKMIFMDEIPLMLEGLERGAEGMRGDYAFYNGAVFTDGGPNPDRLKFLVRSYAENKGVFVPDWTRLQEQQEDEDVALKTDSRA